MNHDALIDFSLIQCAKGGGLTIALSSHLRSWSWWRRGSGIDRSVSIKLMEIVPLRRIGTVPVIRATRGAME